MCYLQNRSDYIQNSENRTTGLFYMTCFIIVNQLVLWDPPVKYYSISRQWWSTFNPKHSVSRHELSRTVCLQLRKVPLPSEKWTVLSYIWHSLLFLLPLDSNSWHTVPPINVFDIYIWHWHCYSQSHSKWCMV